MSNGTCIFSDKSLFKLFLHMVPAYSFFLSKELLYNPLINTFLDIFIPTLIIAHPLEVSSCTLCNEIKKISDSHTVVGETSFSFPLHGALFVKRP